MATDNPPDIRAILRSIEVQTTGDLGKWMRSKYSVELSVGDKVVSKSKAKSLKPILKWEWDPGHEISIQPSSMMKIVVYRGFGTPLNLGKVSVAQHEEIFGNLLDNVDATFDLTFRDHQVDIFRAKLKIALFRAPTPGTPSPQQNPYVAIGGLPADVVHPETTLDHAKEAGSVAYAGLKTVAEALYNCSDIFLPLKTAAGVILEITKVIDGVLGNKNELVQLEGKLKAILSIVKKYQQHGGLGPLTHRIKTFCSAIDLQLERVEALQKKSLLTRTAMAKDDANAILKALRDIEGLCDVFQMDTQLRTEEIVGDIWQLLDSNVIDKLYHETTSYKTRQSSYGEATSCLEGTRTEVLDDLDAWALDPDGKRVYWMVGMAGIGKSTIAHTFCERLEAKNMLCGSFFASRSSEKTRNARLIIPVIAHSLAAASPPMKIRVTKAIKDDPTLAEPTYVKLSEQFQQLISNPLSSTAGMADMPYGKVVVIDALDECDRLEVVASLIKVILQSISRLPIKVFISSQEESEITKVFKTGDNEAKNFRLHDIEKDVVRGDIRRYLKMSLDGIRGKHDDGWPPDSELEGLVARSGTLFIYAATAVRYISSHGGKRYKSRLSEMAKQGLESVIDFKTNIDSLYIHILEMACKQCSSHEISRMRDVVSMIVFLRHPLPIQAIESLSDRDVSSDLSQLASVIYVPDQPEAVVALFHASFADFITNAKRCSPERCTSFRSLDASEGHKLLALRCLLVMNRLLKFNICDIPEESTISHRDRTNSLADASRIPEALKYSCVYWAAHLENVKVFDPELVDALRYFLHKHLLHWIECRSILGELQSGVKSLYNIVPVLSKFNVDNLHLLVDDTRRCLQLSFEVVQKHCMEIYQSAVVWLPKKSLLRKTYVLDPRIMPKVIFGLDNSWGPTEFVLQNGSLVRSVAFSPDGSRVASGLHDNTVRIWNVMTGEVETTLKGHTGWVSSVAFLYDGSQVVSGSHDGTVRIWNVTTGEVETTLKGHTDPVMSVAFSQDGTRVVSGSDDKMVRIWNVTTGKLETTLEGHTDPVLSVAFSPDGTRVASGSYDARVIIWNVTTGEVETTLRGLRDLVTSVAFLQDGTRVASGSYDGTVRIWNMTTGKVETTLEGHKGSVTSIALSLDGTRVASASYDRTVRIWNVTTGEVETTLEGHTGSMTSVAFSQDSSRVVSGSYDRIVQIWNLTTAEARVETMLKGHTSSVTSVAFSQDGARVVSGSDDKMVRIWNVITGKLETTLEGHTDPVLSVAFSQDGTRVVSGSSDKTVRIWDVTTGNVQLMTSSSITLPDGSRVDRLRWDFIIFYPSPKPSLSMESPLQISDDVQWIIASFRHCWIPSQYRDIRCFTTWGNKICFGCRSGRIVMFDMSPAL